MALVQRRAAEAVLGVLGGANADTAVSRVDTSGFDGATRAALTDLTFGTLRFLGEVRGIARLFVHQRPDALIEALLWVALYQLRLRETPELTGDVEKRDFGTWLHAVLRRFHEALQRDPDAERTALLDAAAQQATREQGLDEEPGEFLPFMAAWPRLRDAYLQWLAAHEADGAAFETAEQVIDVQRGALKLGGRIDRIDRLADGTPLLIDYKTEALTKTRDRVKAGSEDTQLPFYALLAGGEAPRAFYLNLAERETPSAHELPDLPALAAQLYDGMSEDVARIQAGAPLPALGEGSVCDWCAVRGLCRKDFWA